MDNDDDKKDVFSYSVEEILEEAKYVLDLFVNPSHGHINNEALCGEEGENQRKWAKSQVSKLRRFIKANESYLSAVYAEGGAA